MIKCLSSVTLLLASYTATAGFVPGDVNIALMQSTDNHTYKLRLIVNNSAATSPTLCMGGETSTLQTLPYGAIGVSKAKLTLQAADCDSPLDKWITLIGSLDYDSNYWYTVYVNMADKAFYL